ncbi:cell-cell cohesion protein MtsD [Stigmatella aurantiaca]|uniref:MtsD protein involved in cell-cell cohesion n=1 Tax=Stigmatella aurantiaca (strain DW4/3-1) TaxID=378806 RepID=Q097F2_STIAD|nr:vWA domain-containing protein [Stigmatella aurantiaca]ADO69855.1 MtsD protein involved in cell-cell cohesion [Stigmatella aurantiaca DW4/3-1]EAU67876.1 thrombospondin type 3 repeat family [Stigmatella aurantiaca DW4/3-1]
MHPHPRMLMAAGLLASLLASCTDTLVEPLVQEQSLLDDRLTLAGRVCTAPSNPSGFPVKVVLVIDQSGSMCVSDPPGSQGVDGFCEQVDDILLPPGVLEPARVRALKRLVNQFRQQPNVQISIVPFETNVKNVWPPATTGNRFARPDASLDTYIRGLQNQLGKGTDYQGAVGYAYSLIASDINAVSASNPEVLPRTRYVVVFLTDGTPYPRCSANDNLSAYATPDSPDLTWADSSSAGDFCNLLDPDSPDSIEEFQPGTDRNQNYQLFSYVRRLMELKDQYNVGDIRMHTVLLFNQQAVRLCGPICQDIYGTYPGVTPAEYPQAAKKVAAWLLARLAEIGNGVYQEFNDTGEINNMGLGALDYSSFASRNVLKTLMVRSLSAIPGESGRELDTDGDGVGDLLDNTFTLQTNAYVPDSDGDCLDDGFETRRQDQGFKPGNDLDARGCDPNSPLTRGCACRDTDGDGLSQFAEAYLRTRDGIVDSDGDGVPDGIESRYGLDPLTANVSGLDTDGDGIPDSDELRAESDPTRRDRAFYERYGYQYGVKIAERRANGSTCYDFTVSNLQLVTPPNRSGVQQGYNLFKVWFAEAPESGVATDYGVWRTACAWAQYAPPGLRVPLGASLALEDGNFRRPQDLDEMSEYMQRCVGDAPGAAP